ncbi:VOC family protein [Amycolatopsis sp. NPDC052450]|uniref:VOC family protein n=1 Tax=Amycolatopsis sp. NPDC052450 TaxID=3363937 RepID=UPI0037CBDC51
MSWPSRNWNTPPDGHGGLELIKYRTPEGQADSRLPMNTPGIRHFVFSVEDIDDVLGRLWRHGGELVGELAEELVRQEA